MVSHFVWLFFFDSSCKLCFFFFYCPFFLMYPRIKKVVFWWNCWKNYLLYSVSVLLFFLERQCARKNPLYFPLFLKLFESFSHFTSTHRKNRQKKAFIFCFCPVPFLIDFFLSTFFPFLFHHCCLCSLFPFIFLFISTCFALLLFSLFSPSFFFFSSSVFLFLCFPQSHVSLSFFHRRFCVSSFGWINSFLFSLLFLISFPFSSLFFFVSVSFLSCQTKCKIFSFFFAEDFFWTLPFSVFNLVFFLIASSLFLVCSMFFWIFERFSKLLYLIFFLSIIFSGLFRKMSLFLDTTFKKYHSFLLWKITFGKNPCFLDFDLFFFAFDFFFSCMIFNISFFVFLVQTSCFFCLNLFVSVQKKKNSKNKLILFNFVFTLLVLTLPELLSLVVFILHFFSVPFLLFCLFMFPLLMFNYSPYVYLFSLMFLLFVFIPFFLTLFIPCFKPFFSNSFVSSFFFWFFNLVLSNKVFFFWESFLDHCSIWVQESFFFQKKKKTEDLELLRNSLFFFFCKNCQRNCWCNKQYCPDLICGNVHVFWTSIKMSSLFRKVLFKSSPSCFWKIFSR